MYKNVEMGGGAEDDLLPEIFKKQTTYKNNHHKHTENKTVKRTTENQGAIIGTPYL